jgi:cytidine deaminase
MGESPASPESRTEHLLAEARLAAANAHSPYSGWRVGAAVEFTETAATVFRGANVENGSYGLTICAERAAICSGVVAGGRTLRRVALVCFAADGSLVPAIVPCGACLQVIHEFGSADTEIVIEGGGTFRLADFLPRPFGTGVSVPRQGS